VVGIDVAGFALDRPIVVPDGLVKLLAPMPDEAPAVIGEGIARIE